MSIGRHTILGYNNTFKVVNYLDESAINIVNIAEIIMDYFISNGIPSELNELSSHTIIDEVTDILINNINITPYFIDIICEGNIVATLNYDNKEDDTSFEMSFPFEMKALWLVIGDLEAMKIDTLEF